MDNYTNNSEDDKITEMIPDELPSIEKERYRSEQTAPYVFSSAWAPEGFAPEKPESPCAVPVLTASKAVSRVALISLAFLIVATAAQMALGLVVGLMISFIPGMAFWLDLNSSAVMLIIGMIPVFLIAWPISILMMKNMPKAPLPVADPGFGLGRIVLSVITLFGVGYGGNLISTWLSGVIGSWIGVEAENPLISVVDGVPWYWLMLFVVIGPGIMEELFFRKICMDYLRPFGDWLAVLTTALCFGLIHGNLYQFVYAFGLGIVLAYVYLKTGKIWICMIMHMLFNFMGSVVSEAFSKLFSDPNISDTEALAQVFGQITPLGIGFIIFTLFVYCSIVGAIIIILLRRKEIIAVFSANKQEGIKIGSTIFGNGGMIVLIIVCVTMFLISLALPLITERLSGLI